MRSTTKTAARTEDPKRLRDGEAALDTLEALVSRFQLPERREVRRLVRSSERLADLAAVFPGAIHALATRRGPAAARLQAIAMIEQGAALKAVARVLDLPLWLRRLPPEAFHGMIGPLPSSETFTRRVAARLPRTAAETQRWLDTVAFAADACHEDFALWLAQQPLYSDAIEPDRLFAVLAAYAWFSGEPSTRASTLIVQPWRTEIGFDTALCAAKSWLNRMRLVMQLETGVVGDTWLAGGRAMGFEFVPLADQQAILAESQYMQNCADQYSDRIARDKCRLFSVRRGEQRLATLEVGPHSRETGILTITQLKARHNMPAALEVWQAAHAWLATQTGLKRLPPMLPPDRPLDGAVWADLMAPYRQKKRGAPWLPETASHSSFGALDLDLAELARRAGVSSWLFT